MSWINGWADARLRAVRHDLLLVDRGVDPETLDRPKASLDETRLRLEGQEAVLLDLTEAITGTRPEPRIVKPAWKPRDGKVPGTVEWTREGVRIRDEKGQPGHDRWAIFSPLPDGRLVCTCYATTLLEAMDLGDADVKCAAEWAKEHQPSKGEF